MLAFAHIEPEATRPDGVAEYTRTKEERGASLRRALNAGNEAYFASALSVTSNV